MFHWDLVHCLEFPKPPQLSIIHHILVINVVYVFRAVVIGVTFATPLRSCFWILFSGPRVKLLASFKSCALFFSNAPWVSPWQVLRASLYFFKMHTNSGEICYCRKTQVWSAALLTKHPNAALVRVTVCWLSFVDLPLHWWCCLRWQQGSL